MCEQIETARLTLRRWRLSDAEDFAELHSDVRAMRDLGGPISRSASDRKLQDYIEAWDRHGYGRWCVRDGMDRFLGYVGLNKEGGDHPLGDHSEIGWRLSPTAWGKGYASEAARVALREAFVRNGLTEVLAYTAPDNAASQAVIAKLPFDRATASDFSVPWAPLGSWHGLVWRTDPIRAAALL